jgi:hypothetical protein
VACSYIHRNVIGSTSNSWLFPNTISGFSSFSGLFDTISSVMSKSARVESVESSLLVMGLRSRTSFGWGLAGFRGEMSGDEAGEADFAGGLGDAGGDCDGDRDAGLAGLSADLCTSPGLLAGLLDGEPSDMVIWDLLL